MGSRRPEKMHAEAVEIGTGSNPRRSVVGSGGPAGSIRPRLQKLGYIKFLTLADLDQRSRAAQRCKEHIANLGADLGGADRLTTGQRQLIQRAALLAVMLEDFELRHC